MLIDCVLQEYLKDAKKPTEVSFNKLLIVYFLNNCQAWRQDN